MSLSVVNCPKTKLINGMVSMVTKSIIPVVKMLIEHFTAKGDTLCPSQLSIAQGKSD